jgi:hypothetical protein
MKRARVCWAWGTLRTILKRFLNVEFLQLFLTDWKEAETRLVNMRERLVKRGIAADAVQPEWCHQVPGSMF